MRTLTVVAVALFLFNGTMHAMVNGAVSNAVTVTTGNILDKLIDLVNDYTKRVETAGTIDELNELYAGLVTAMKQFAKNNAAELAAFDADITAQKEKEYKVALDAAVKQFEKALEKKAMQFFRK